MDKYLSNKFKVISFVSIVMVVYIHAYNLLDRELLTTTIISDPMSFTSFFEYFISNGITRIAVPIFFFISGYLFFINFKPSLSSFLDKYKKRIKTLLIPYLLWNIVAIIFMFLIQDTAFFRSLDLMYFKVNPSIEDIFTRMIYNPVGFQFWFVRDLMIYVILSPVIYLYISLTSYFSMIPLFVLWMLNIPIPVISNEGILFFIIGSLMAIKKVKMKKNSNKLMGNTLFIAWIFLCCLRTYLAFFASADLIHYLYRVNVIIGFIAVWMVYDLYIDNIGEENTIIKLSSYTFFVFAGHEPILNIFMEWTLSVFGTTTSVKLITYILVPFITILFLIGIAKILNNYGRFFFNILTGGRTSKRVPSKEKSHSA